MMIAPIDIVFLLIILLCSVLAAMNGFLNEVFGKAAPVVAVWVALIFYKPLVLPIQQYVKNPTVSVILAFVLVFVMAFIVVKLMQSVIKNIFGGEIFTQLDRFLGVIFGIIEGVAVVCVILILLRLQPWFPVSSILEKSFFDSMLNPFVREPLNGFIQSVNSKNIVIQSKAA